MSNTEKRIDKEEIGSGLEIKTHKDIEKNSIFNNKKKFKDTDKRVMSKSAQKYRKNPQENPNCEKCQKFKDQN